MRLIILACVFFVSHVSAGEIYKCGQGDNVVYQQSPCADGKKMEVQTSKGVTQYTPMQEKPYSWADRVNDKFDREKEREDYLDERIANPYVPQNIPKKVPSKKFSDGNKTRNCVNASKALDKHKKIMKKGYGAGASNYLRKRKRMLEDSVRKYCA